MDLVRTSDPGHPLLSDFVALNEPATRRRVERDGDHFVVEGIVALERLLSLPHWQIRSIALLPKVADRLADRLRCVDAPLVVAEAEVLGEVVGFDLHRGALASVGRRPPAPLARLVDAGRLFLAAEGVNDHENLGSLYRNAAAFGADAVVLDPTCADPFYRRSVRVSLGNVMAVPTARTLAFPAGVEQLHRLGVTTVALSPTAERTLTDLELRPSAGSRVALVVGAEGPGLTTDALTAASYRVRIPMATGVDSLNVATAAAVALHHLTSHP